jgi:crotonobetainyl-CoA:carnitine CoA-transferase CaiB-like acyl-CoA transferase
MGTWACAHTRSYHMSKFFVQSSCSYGLQPPTPRQIMPSLSRTRSGICPRGLECSISFGSNLGGNRMATTSGRESANASALEGIRVLDLSSYLAQNCARIMGDLGADVIKIEPPGGDPARLLPPFAGGKEDPERSLRFLNANRSKRSVVLDPESPEDRSKVAALADRVDIVVEDFAPGYLSSIGLGYADLATRNPALIYVSITPFGQTGPHASYVAGDLISQATGGIMFANGDDTAPPVRAPYEIISQMACLHAAFGALLAIRARSALSGHGQHVDVSRQEVVLWSQSSYISRYSMQDAIARREGHHSAFGAVNTYRTSDGGYVNLSCYNANHFSRLARDVMKHPVLSEEVWFDRNLRMENREIIDQFVQEYADTVTRDDFVDRAQGIGLPIVPVLSPSEYVDHPHAAARGFWEESTHPVVGDFRTAGPPFRMSETPFRPKRPAPLLGEHTEEVLAELATPTPSGSGPANGPAESAKTDGTGTSPKPLDGIRIIDFTRAFAGPIATMYLGFFGAEVIKVESADLDDNRSPDQSTFADLNRNKISCTIDGRTEEGKDLIKQLVADGGIVVENFRPGVMDRMGIGYDVLKKIRPDVIMLAMPGMGNSGPLRDYFCYGQQIMGVAGLTYLWGHEDGAMDTRIKMPFADYVAAILGALSVVTALHHRDLTGKGQYIELAQLEGAAHLLNVGSLDYIINGVAPKPVGNRSEVMGPHGVYPCMGHDAWCAIEVATDDQWRALVSAMGDPAWAQDDRFASNAGRIANAVEMDERLAAWTAEFTSRQVERLLQKVGVPAGIVANGEDLFNDLHLRSRPDVITGVVHLDEGPIEHQGVNVQLTGTPGKTAPSPAKGQHNEYVFREVLGIEPARQRELEDSGVLK